MPDASIKGEEVEERGVLGLADTRGQGDEEELVKRAKKEQPVSRRRAQRAGTWESRGKEILARRTGPLGQVVPSSLVSWGHNTDHRVWQHS